MRTLLLFAHPALEKSRVHSRLLEAVPSHEAVTFRDLYQLYPDFDIDVPREQELLAAHQLVLFQHPFYWYSVPALLKQWFDLVLVHGWAYGSTGTALQGKCAASVISTGGGSTAYRRDGLNRFSVREFLAPVEQTVRLCGMEYLPPYLIQGTHRMTPGDIAATADRYGRALGALAEDRIPIDAWRAAERLDALLDGEDSR